MRVALIGSGHIAKIHGPSIQRQSDYRIVGIADKDIERAKATAEKLGVVHFYDDASVMISEQKPDIVHVLTPPKFHAELSILAMNHGCHVLVEKPMALTVEEAKEMMATAKQNNVQLCVNHNMVFESVVQRTKKSISRGLVGKIVSVEACYLFDARRYPAILEEGARFFHWSYQLNGGPLQDLIPHPASLIFEFIPEIQSIHAIGKNRGVLPKDWQDEVRVLVGSKEATGYLSVSLREKPDTITLTIKGTEGTIQADLFNDIVTLRRRSYFPRAIARGLSGFHLAWQNLFGALRNVIKFLTGQIDKTNGVAPLIAAFYETIRQQNEPPISAEKSLSVVALISKIWPSPLGSTTPPHAAKIKKAGPITLVTGASGFIGTHLIRKLLSEGISVRALARSNSTHKGRLLGLDIDILEGDLTNPKILYEAAEGVNTIFHAGSPTTSNWEEFEKGAVDATATLIKAAIANNVDRFVQFSSLAVYELLDVPSNTIREDSAFQKNPKMMGPYAWAKIETEKLVLEACKNQGLKATIVRPGIVIGPMGNLFFPHLGFKSQDCLFILIGKGDTVLPLTFVENTVDAIYQASIVEKAIGQTYQIVDDSDITIRQYLDKYVEVTGAPAKIIPLPRFIPYSAAFVYEAVSGVGLLKKGITSRAQLKWKQAKVYFDNKKAKQDLEWQIKIPMNQGLEKTFQWYASKYL